MKKIIAIFIVVFTLFEVINTAAIEETPAKMYIFVQAGAQGGDGTKNAPLGTFEQARDKIRDIKANGAYPEGGIVVYFRNGTYVVTESMNLTEEDSGKEGAPVVYRSYMEEQVAFVGGVDLSVSEFSHVADTVQKARLNNDAVNNILCVNLRNYGITDYGELNMYGAGLWYFDAESRLSDKINTNQSPELFFGDSVGMIARYPNDGYIKTGRIIQPGDEIQMWSSVFKTTTNFIPFEERVYPPKPSIYLVDKTTASRMKKWSNENEVWVYGYFGESWSDISLPVRSINYENGEITTQWPSPKPIKSDMNYYIYNVLGELDTPGEYYLDRSTGMLYIYPTDPDGKVTFSTLDMPIMTMTSVSNVDFKALSFKGTRQYGVEMWDCNNVSFELCSISKTAAQGVVCYNSKNCSFVSCHFFQLGKGGIYMSIAEKRNDADAPGRDVWYDTDQNLTPQNNVVENCEIDDFARIQSTYSAAVSMGGAGNRISHCKIHGSNHLAIIPVGNDITIEYCEFYDVLRTADDAGAIYNNFNKERRGLKIVNNYFHDINSSAANSYNGIIYPDDTMDGWNVEQNIFANCNGRIMHSNGGRAHIVKNNIAINAKAFANFQNNEIGFTDGKYDLLRYTFPKYLDNPAYAKYPHFADLLEDGYRTLKYIETDNNVLINVASDITTGANMQLNTINRSYVANGDPGFVDFKNGNYTLRENSIIYNVYKDFKAPDFANMGMYTGKLKALLGTNLSFLSGSPKVYNAFAAESISLGDDVAPVIRDGVAYIPLRYITETLGGEITYDGDITVNYTQPVVITPNEYLIVNNTALVSIDKAANLFGMEFKVFDNGVIVLGEKIRLGDDAAILSELARRLNNE